MDLGRSLERWHLLEASPPRKIKKLKRPQYDGDGDAAWRLHPRREGWFYQCYCQRRNSLLCREWYVSPAQGNREIPLARLTYPQRNNDPHKFLISLRMCCQSRRSPLWSWRSFLQTRAILWICLLWKILQLSILDLEREVECVRAIWLPLEFVTIF